MTAAPYTPGPWRHDAHRGVVVAPTGDTVAVVCFHAADSMAQEDAPGRLIAAAPLLLRAAQYALIELTSTVAAQDPAAMRALIVSYLREAIDSATTATTASPAAADIATQARDGLNADCVDYLDETRHCWPMPSPCWPRSSRVSQPRTPRRCGS